MPRYRGRGRGRGGVFLGPNERPSRSDLPADYQLPQLNSTDTLYGGFLCRDGKIALVQNINSATRSQEIAACILEDEVLPPEWKTKGWRCSWPALALIVLANSVQLVEPDFDEDQYNDEGFIKVEWVPKRYWNAITFSRSREEDYLLVSYEQYVTRYLAKHTAPFDNPNELLTAIRTCLVRMWNEPVSEEEFEARVAALEQVPESN